MNYKPTIIKDQKKKMPANPKPQKIYKIILKKTNKKNSMKAKLILTIINLYLYLNVIYVKNNTILSQI